MTTTTNFQGMDPGAKSSSRVLRPPGGTSNISFGTDDDTSQRKNKMVSNIFAEPVDPHAHRRNNPPSHAGAATGTLCGESSAPLRRCQQPLLFPKNPEPELTTIHNSGAAMVWKERRGGEVENGEEFEQPNNECPEAEQEEQKETPQPPAPSGGGADAGSAAAAAAAARRNPPGGKSSLILG